MMGARFLGYGFGMFIAARDPLANVAWINTRIVGSDRRLAEHDRLLARARRLAQLGRPCRDPSDRPVIGLLFFRHPRRLAQPSRHRRYCHGVRSMEAPPAGADEFAHGLDERPCRSTSAFGGVEANQCHVVETA